MDFFTHGNTLTDDAKAMLAWMRGVLQEADEANDLATLNGVAGYMGHFYTNVMKMSTMTEHQWVRDFQHSGAAACWRDYTALQESARQAEAVQETVQQAGDLAEQLEALKLDLEARLEEMRAEHTRQLATLKAQNTKLRNKLNAMQEADAADTDDDDEQPEAEDATKDEAQDAPPAAEVDEPVIEAEVTPEPADDDTADTDEDDDAEPEAEDAESEV